MTDIAVLGYGKIGSGVVEVIDTNRPVIDKKIGPGRSLNIKYLLDIRKYPGDPHESQVVDNFDVILADQSVAVVVECMGGSHPAYDYSLAALRAGKHVITSNKEVVANFGDRLLREAQAHGVHYLFEASVGGGTPVIRPIHQCLSANVITGICGILNGTTNFILTKMLEGCDYGQALADAQKRGYAETDPSADVEGKDTARKISILSSLVFGRHVLPDNVHTEGITGISLADVEDAKACGCEVKLLGQAALRPDGHISVITAPFFVPDENPLSGVDDVYNGIQVSGNAIGDVMFYGRGAGKLPTASAVVADVIDAVTGSIDGGRIMWESDDRRSDWVIDYLSCERRLYVRIKDANTSEIRKNFPDAQFAERSGAAQSKTAFITGCGREGILRNRVTQLSGHCESIIRMLE